MTRMDELRETGDKPVRLTHDGHLFIGDDEFAYPVLADSLSFKRVGRRRNLMTLTLFVGEVTMEYKKQRTESFE